MERAAREGRPGLFVRQRSAQEQDNHFQGKVEEDHVRIDILLDVALGIGDFLRDGDDVALVDEAGKVDGKIGLLSVEIVEFRLPEVVDEILAYEPLAVVEKVLLPLASPRGYLLGPLVQVLDLAQVAQAHQQDEEVEEHGVVLMDEHFLECAHIAAGAETRHGPGIVGLEMVALGEHLFEVGSGESRKDNLLRAAENGGEQAFGMLGDEEEHGLSGRFFQNLEQLVGCSRIHLLGQPDNHHLVSALRRGQTEFAQDEVAFGHGNERLLVFDTDAAQPAEVVEVGRVGQLFAPFAQIEVADGFAAAGRLDHGKDKMEIGVAPRFQHLARRALAAGFLCLRMAAEQGRCIGQGHGQLSAASGTAEQLGMRYMPFFELAAQEGLDFLLPDDIGKLHRRKFGNGRRAG